MGKLIWRYGISFLVLFFASIVLQGKVMAETMETGSGKCGDNVSYAFDADTGLLKISGTGKMDKWNNEKVLSPFCDMDNIKEIRVENGVTAIGQYAFIDCSGVESVFLSDSVSEINTSAFKSCSSLKSVSLGKNVTELGTNAFRYCSELESITLPEGLNTIGRSVFGGCSTLKKISIPETVTKMEGGVFATCVSLEEANIPVKLKTVPASMFAGCSSLKTIIIPDGITSIEAEAFGGCSSLTDISIPASVTMIGWDSFASCTALEHVTLSKGITDIKTSAFEECSSLVDIKIPDSVVSIENSAFAKCLKLKSITVPDSVTSFGSGAFWGCDNIEKIVLSRNADLQYYSSFPDQAVIYCTKKLSEGFKGYHSRIVIIDDHKVEKCESVAPDSTHDGIEESYYCSICDKYYYDELGSELANELDIIIHNFEDGICTNCGFALKGSCGKKCQWEYHPETNVLTITGSGEITGGDGTNGIPVMGETFGNKISSLVVEEGITNINDYAFCNCPNLKEIQLPNTLKSLGSYVFKGCSKLEQIEIPDNVVSLGSDVFNGCSSLKSAKLSDKLTGMGAAVFKGCGKLEEVTLPTGVKTIGYNAFEGCESLKRIVLPDQIAGIGEKAFFNCSKLEEVVMPHKTARDSLYTNSNSPYVPSGAYSEDGIIGKYAFAGCSSLKKIEISNGITHIMDNAFKDCVSLEEVSFPDSIMKTYSSAFDNCEKLETIKGSSSVLYCDDLAGGGGIFGATSSYKLEGIDQTKIRKLIITGEDDNYSIASGCRNYRNVSYIELTGSITEVKARTFTTYGSEKYWDNLETVILSEGIQKIGAEAFMGLRNLKSISIPDSVKEIGLRAFYGSGISDVKISKELKEIEEGLFSNCSKLTEVSIPTGVTKIGKKAFENCESLTNIEIPDGVTEIGDYAFAGCKNLKAITVPASVVSIGENAFDNSSKISISYQKGSYAEKYAKDHGFAQADENPSDKPVVKEEQELPQKTKSNIESPVNVKQPGRVSLSSAKNQKRKTAEMKWKKINDVSGYEVQYAIDKKFKKSAKTKTVKSTKKTSLTIKKLKKGKTYYVRVRAYVLDGSKKVYGKWSKTKKVKIKK